MEKRILSLVFGAFLLTPGDSPGFARPPSRPAPQPVPRHVPLHTPAYVAPRSVRPVYHPPVRRTPPVTVRPFVRPPVTAQPIFRQPVVGIGNRPVVANRPVMVNRGIYINRGPGYYRPGYAHYYPYHDRWHHGYWTGWYNRPWLWFGGGVAAGWLWGSTPNVVYVNPYWIAPPVVAAYDYSQPIPVPEPIAVPPDPNDVYTQSNTPPPFEAVDPNAAAAAKILDSARQAFLANDYNNALQMVDRAISSSPKDTTLHEFRALVLFAQRRYQDATATIYAVLAVGPGWDWNTLSSFYRDPQIYTAQLRALEEYTRANPKEAGPRFLLAYHYLVTDHRDAAARALRSVVALQPNDQLATYMLQTLEKKEQPPPPAPGM